jgi:hypothetical protein
VRGVFASVLVLIAAVCVVLLIAPPEWPAFPVHPKRPGATQADATPASSPALPEGRLVLVSMAGEDVVFLAEDESRIDGAVADFTSLIITPAAASGEPTFTVVRESADCRRRISLEATYAGYDQQGRKLTHSEAANARANPGALERLMATDQARREAGCGARPHGAQAEIIGWQTALAAAPSLAAAGKAMAARSR